MSNDFSEAKCQFGMLEAWGLTVTIALVQFPGEEILRVGYGASRKEALEDAFLEAYPSAKKFSSTPAVDWSPHLVDKPHRSRRKP